MAGYIYELVINGKVRARHKNEFRGGVIAEIVEWLPLIVHKNKTFTINIVKDNDMKGKYVPNVEYKEE